MADSLSPTSPEYINVNCDTKPDTSKFNKDLPFSKSIDVNQNKDFEKSSSSDKFKNSPLLADKKHLLSPRSSPQPRRSSPAQPEEKVINSPPPVVEQFKPPSVVEQFKPQSVVEQFKPPSPSKGGKIVNSPRSARSSVSNGQEFRIINPTSRTASVSSPVESPIHSSQDFLAPRVRSPSDNDSLGDEEILDLLSDDATDLNSAAQTRNSNSDEVFGENINSADVLGENINSSDVLGENINLVSDTTNINSIPFTENISSNTMNFTNDISMDQTTVEPEINGNDMMLLDEDLLDETIAELQLLDAEGLADDSYDKDIHESIEIIQNRSSVAFDSEEALSGLLEIAEMASDDFG